MIKLTMTQWQVAIVFFAATLGGAGGLFIQRIYNSGEYTLQNAFLVALIIAAGWTWFALRRAFWAIVILKESTTKYLEAKDITDNKRATVQKAFNSKKYPLSYFL